jgi:hypothetical protein
MLQDIENNNKDTPRVDNNSNSSTPLEVIEARKARPDCSVSVELSTRISFQTGEHGTKDTSKSYYLLCPSEPKKLIHLELHTGPIQRSDQTENRNKLGEGIFGTPIINTEPLIGEIWRSILRKERRFHEDGGISRHGNGGNGGGGSISV